MVLYLGGLAAGAVAGLLLPALASTASHAVEPLLALLLFATFLAVPLRRVRLAVSDARFVVTLLVVNFVLVPPIVWLLSRPIAHDDVLLVGVLFVLLTPCIDYVIVFARIAGGDAERLLATTPLLMALQALLLPVYLWLFGGPGLVGVLDPWPFVRAFLFIVLLPLLAAGLVQVLAARSRPGRVLGGVGIGAAVPLMVLTLAAVVASQVAAVGADIRSLVVVVPIFVLFVVVSVPLGALAGRIADIDVAGRRALSFSAVTRNSLVVLPLALALPERFHLTPLVVVTQTLVELVAMVVLIRLVPRLIRHGPGHVDADV